MPISHIPILDIQEVAAHSIYSHMAEFAEGNRGMNKRPHSITVVRIVVTLLISTAFNLSNGSTDKSSPQHLDHSTLQFYESMHNVLSSTTVQGEIHDANASLMYITTGRRAAQDWH